MIAPSHTEDRIKAIVGNPVTIEAHSAGLPADGRAVPDGAMIVKIEWTKKPNTVSPLRRQCAGRAQVGVVACPARHRDGVVIPATRA